jgi:hypothetical protein
VGELGVDACGRCEDYNDWGRLVVLTVGLIYSQSVPSVSVFFFFLLADFQHSVDAAPRRNVAFALTRSVTERSPLPQAGQGRSVPSHDRGDRH